ncbi:MAG: hypothetical protein HQK58_02510 [Deltaproteobacteria bacterium]|nr:hypothetical protein [Deltaproteobacteria bacterium]
MWPDLWVVRRKTTEHMELNTSAIFLAALHLVRDQLMGANLKFAGQFSESAGHLGQFLGGWWLARPISSPQYFPAVAQKNMKN